MNLSLSLPLPLSLSLSSSLSPPPYLSLSPIFPLLWLSLSLSLSLSISLSPSVQHCSAPLGQCMDMHGFALLLSLTDSELCMPKYWEHKPDGGWNWTQKAPGEARWIKNHCYSKKEMLKQICLWLNQPFKPHVRGIAKPNRRICTGSHQVFSSLAARDALHLLLVCRETVRTLQSPNVTRGVEKR